MSQHYEKKSSNKVEIVLLVVIILVAITARILPGARTVDDSYITYRYARNILAGNGFVYNPGERVLGTTTPLYTILLVILGSLNQGTGTDFPVLAMYVNSIADAITCLLLYMLGRRLGFSVGGAGAALLWAIAPFSVTFAIGGLETSVYVLLLISTCYFFTIQHYYLASWLAALAILTRPDALILVAPLIFTRLWQYSQEFKRTSTASGKVLKHLFLEAGLFLLPLAIWFGFAVAFFGSPLPHSITAKRVAYLLPENSALIRLLQHYATPFLGHFTFGIPWIYVGIILFPFLNVLGTTRILQHRQDTWAFMIYPWLYFAVYAIANPLIFRWYLTPPLPIYFLGIMTGIESIFTFSRSIHWGDKSLQTSKLIMYLVILFLAFLSLRGWVLKPDHGPNRPAPEMAWYKLELKYQEAADYVTTYLSPPKPEDLYLAASDVGVLGFFTKAKILDTVGLNSPQSIPYYPLEASQHINAYAIPAKLILDELPDVIVILEVYGRASLLVDDDFWNLYRLEEKIPTDIYNSDGMLIFVRKDY